MRLDLGASYLGWVELSLRHERMLRDLLADAAKGEPSRLVKAIHVYPVRERYTIVAAGRPTEVGLRG